MNQFAEFELEFVYSSSEGVIHYLMIHYCMCITKRCVIRYVQKLKYHNTASVLKDTKVSAELKVSEIIHERFVNK